MTTYLVSLEHQENKALSRNRFYGTVILVKMTTSHAYHVPVRGA